MKKLILFASAVIMLVLMLSVTANAATLADLQASFPAGKYWNHYVSNESEAADVLKKNGNNSFANSVSDSPCYYHGYTSASYYVGHYDCNVFAGAMQCMGFARKLAYDAYGDASYALSGGHTNINNIKPGDVVQYHGAGASGDDGHTVFVIGVSGTTITVGECNWGGRCLINWGRSFDLRNATSYTIYSAPYALSTAGQSSLTSDSKYSQVKGFKAYPCVSENFQCYNSDLTTSSGEIYTSDYCTIEDVYTNGWCKVSCPWSDNSVKTVYTKISNFIKNPSASLTKYTSTEYINLYSTSSLSTRLKEYRIYPGDVCYTIGTSGSATQIFMPMSSGGYYVLGWVSTSALNSTPSSLEKPTVSVSSQFVQRSTPVTLSWNAVSGATYYGIDIWRDGKQVEWINVGNTTSYTYNYPDGVMDFFVIAYNSAGSATSGGKKIIGYVSDYCDGANEVYTYLVQTLKWYHLDIDGNNNVKLMSDSIDNTDPKQIWKAVKNSDGSYVFYNQYNGKVLTAESALGGSNVKVADYTGSDLQRWYLAYVTDSGFKLVLKANADLMLNVEGSLEKDNNVGIAYSAELENQRFSIYALSNDNTVFTKPAKPAESKITAIVDNDKVNFSWTDSPLKDSKFDLRTYDLRVWKGENVTTGDKYYFITGMTGTSLDGIAFEPGTYTANITAVNSKFFDWYTFGTTVTFHICDYTYQVNKAPTASANGTLLGTCSLCFGTTTVTVPKISDTYYVYEVIEQSSCTKTGIGRYTWTEETYNSFYFDVTIPTVEHDFAFYLNNDDETCTNDGTMTSKCKYCDATDTVIIEGTALGHSFTNYISNGDATCTSDGTETAKCSRCSATDTVSDVESALGHDWKSATCTAAKICKVCGEVEGKSLGHSFTNYISNGDATCTSDGTKTAKCDRCSATKTVTDTGSALGHSYDLHYDEMYHWHECVRCNDIQNQAAHVGGEATYTNRPECEVCGKEYGELLKKNGFISEGGVWKYYVDGIAKTGWVRDSGAWYYMNSYGAMQTGWVQVSGAWYYMNAYGVMQTGWVKVSGAWYYMDAYGAMQTGWVHAGGAWYYMNASGAMQTGWVHAGGAWYYMNTSGVMQTGWVQVGGAWYYMNASGAMQTGWVHVGGAWYYMNASGVMQTGWVQVGGAWYYMNASGVMVANKTLTIGGIKYTFDANGVWVA